MGEKYPLPPITLRYQGLFDFDGFYATVIDWAKNYGYMWHEKAYKHKVPSPKGAEQEMDWEMTTNVTEFVRFSIIINLHAWDMTEVEVEVDDRKRNLTNARLILKINGSVNTDWQSKFASGTPFAKKLGALYEKMVAGKEIVAYWDPLYYRIWNLHAVIKKYFDMQAKKNAYKGYIGES